MSKLSNLVSKGVRLIVADDAESEPEAEAPAPVERAPRGRTPRELPAEALEVEPPKSVQRSQLAADVVAFSEVYAEAGIELPLHGYGIEKVGEMLENKRLAAMTREVKATAVLAALEAAGVELKDVIQDGVRRDKALDAFLAGKTSSTQELRGKSEARIEQIREQIAAFLREKNTEIEELKKAAEAAVLSLTRLEERKLREEERLHGILSHFIESAANPITRAKAAVPDKPASTS